MRCAWRWLITSFAVISVAFAAAAATLRVPLDYPTIQAGINAAQDGDTVLVADGVYTGAGNRDIDFWGKRIRVMSENGPETTIIDCQGSASAPHRAFYFHRWEDSTSVVQGFTITGGYATTADGGGAIYCRYSSPSIIGNTIIGNRSEQRGGGIYCLQWSSPIIADNIITQNVSEWGGGGIYCEIFSSPSIVANVIIANSALSSGGGIHCVDHAEPMIAGSLITENTAGTRGGGIHCYFSTVPRIVGSTIARNSAGVEGGGIGCNEWAHPIMMNCTIAANTAPYASGLIAISSTPSLINSVVWMNWYAPAIVGECLVSYCDVEGGWPGEGNIDADPIFVLADRGDYRLLWESPCIDAGHPDSLDPDGTRRDMGAHVFDHDDYLTLYLTPDEVIVNRGDEFGVTYTAINRWSQPETFWMKADAVLPNGDTLGVRGPARYTLPPGYTAQVHLSGNVPPFAPFGRYDYHSKIGVPPSTLYDEDRFSFLVLEP